MAAQQYSLTVSDNLGNSATLLNKAFYQPATSLNRISFNAGYSSATNNQIFVDDIQWTTVPAPASAWLDLAGLGGLVLIVRRRRRA